MDTLEKGALSMKWITNISLVIFCLVMYLGIQGYQNPNIVLQWISLIAFIIFILTLIPSYIINLVSDWKHSEDNSSKKKLKVVLDYLLPIITLIILFFWAKFRTYAPLYGEHKTYNPFSLIKLGPIYLGQVIKTDNNIEMSGGIGSYILKLYKYILTTISIMTYIYGLSWITRTDGLISSIISVSSIIYITITKSILGYVPRNKKLEEIDSKFLEFMQYRVYEDNWISKLGAFIRRFTLLGLDTDILDKMIKTREYNNILPQKSEQEYEQSRKEFINKKMKGETSFIEKWKWETLPYLYHWFILSLIGYILGGIFLIIVYGIK